jgi:hypothetical protein
MQRAVEVWWVRNSLDHAKDFAPTISGSHRPPSDEWRQTCQNQNSGKTERSPKARPFSG